MLKSRLPASQGILPWKVSILLAMLAVLLVLPVFLPPVAQAQTSPIGPEEGLSPEAQLAERYAPVTYLKRQRHSCDPTGEAYLPLPINAVMDDPSVILRLDTGGDSAAQDLIVTTGPSMVDIAWLGEGYYLDFPGNPLRPGCRFEHWSKSKAKEYEPTVYAHIATEVREDGEEGLALQYWLFWVFNDFNNRHEGDWEMIQLTFAASTVEEALAQTPESIVYAQHGGAERADWDDDKVRREGSHPVIYSAAGSHASYFDDRVFIGWGPGGTGFGCDVTTGPGRRVPLSVVLIPDEAYMDSTFAWLLFRGRWGEKQVWEFNGPVGPQRGKKWNQPVSWIDTVRTRSLYVSDTLDLGPSPASVFCTVTGQGSKVLMFFTLHPKRVAAIVIALFALGVYLFVSLRASLVRAARLYLTHLRSFVAIGVVLIPVGIVVSSLQNVITANPPGEWVVGLIGRSDEARLVFALLLGGARVLIEAVLVGPAVVAIIQMIRRGEPVAAGRAWRQTLDRLPELFRSYIRIEIALLLRVVTIVGIPFAVRDAIRWTFFGRAVMIDGAVSVRGASSTSAAAVFGRWWRTAAEYLVFTAISLVPGPFIGIVLMVFFDSSIRFVNGLSSLIYAVVVPYSIIGLTLWYLDLTGRPLSPRAFVATRNIDPEYASPGAVASQSEGTRP